MSQISRKGKNVIKSIVRQNRRNNIGKRPHEKDPTNPKKLRREMRAIIKRRPKLAAERGLFLQDFTPQHKG